MKVLLTIIIVFSSFAIFPGEKIDIIVKGMVCSFCAQGISKKFKEIPSVKNINVNLETHLVSIDVIENQKLDNQIIEKILKEAGYGLESITRK